MSSQYEIAPIFLIRLAGLPFDIIERFATSEVARTARELINKGGKFGGDEQSMLSALLECDLERARKSLHDTARSVLPAYLIFAGDGMRERLAAIWANESENDGTPPPRNKRARERERHILLYLQRLAAKADTFSEFGPTGWGQVDNSVSAILLAPAAGVALRDAFLERWTAHAVAGAMNADPDVFGELSPRLNPNARLEENKVILTDSGESIDLDKAELELLNQCNGVTTLASLGDRYHLVRSLVARNILLCEVEVPSFEPRAVDILLADVKSWRASPARGRWMQILRPLAELPLKFVAAPTNHRQEILDQARVQLASLGAERKAGGRSLYAATNPIAEECFRQCNFRINRQMIDEVTAEAAPWIDFWRDSYAFIASRVATALRRVFVKTAPSAEAIPLPGFLRACEMMNLPLTGAGLIAPAVIAFQEVKAAFAERLRPHIDGEEYQLTVDDCHVIRRQFQYPHFDEYTYPSADLQISAESIEAVERGEYDWIIAELHPAVALLQHCMYWACPDKPSLHEALARSTGKKPNFHFGFSAADLTAHTTVHFFDALPHLSFFVAPQRSHPEWQTVAPGRTEVYVDRNTTDVCLRRTDTGQHLGSFARNWLIPLGFHPFQFGMAPHTPRLRCGDVIVQRQSWVVTEAEFSSGDYTGVSEDLVLAIERVRAQKKWPRHVYIRPTEQALRRSGAEGRDKDTKPVFVDLESYPFLEIFYRWLIKAGELEVTEMLPDPQHLLWSESDGRRMFELRTLIVPRS